MHHIIYMSRAAGPMTTAALVELLRQAQTANSRAGVTGLLVYHEGRFMQVLEGEEAAVVATYERIVRDPRHRNLFKLADKPIVERSFLAWSMAFQEVGPAQFSQLAQLAGYLLPARLEELNFVTNPADDTLLHRLRNLVLPRPAASRPPATTEI